MVRGRQPPKSEKHSLRYKCNPIEGVLADFDRESHAPTSSDNSKPNAKKSESKSSQILRAAELSTAVGKIWDCATRPLSVFQPRTSLRHYNNDLTKKIILCYPADDGNGSACSSTKDQYLPINSVNSSSSSPMLQPKLESFKVTQKMSFVKHCGESHTYSLFRNFLQRNTDLPINSLKEKGLASIGILYDLGNRCGWMGDIALARPQANAIQIKNKRTGEYISDTSCSISDDTTSPTSDMIIGSAEFHTEVVKPMNSSPNQTEESSVNSRASITSLYSDYFLGPVLNAAANASACRAPSSTLLTDYYINYLATGNCVCEESLHKAEDDLHKSEKYKENEVITEDQSKVEICSSTHYKPRYGLAKQEHAFSGAMAGIFVSLCLHPVDTIKTAVQSCHTDQRSIHFIGRSIISERGVTGLYRGITSNIACSAPISAVYTSTYESVKGALLPLFPNEFQSLAHCVAGGCASVATSFIFTPSERIKQQMQIGSHYQNCWNALIGIIAKGGLPSLYAGWGAVLCRNVPNSIIKFCTYESLKQLMSSPLQSNVQPSTLHMLVCGGLAGCTAALFTTPFDVVKTRLQTQIPGGVNRYVGVCNTLKDIGKQEGLQGLYRGLTLRLIMYMTQGALFFASYESFKRLLSLDLPQLSTPTVQYEENIEYDFTSLQ